MGSFARTGGRTRLICNHEIRFGGTPATQGTFVIDGAGSYDPTAGGGTTSIDFDPGRFRTPSGGKVRDFVSMRGSVVNAGRLQKRPQGSPGHRGMLRAAASRMRCPSICTRASSIPQAGHRHTKVTGPGGGSRHTQ